MIRLPEFVTREEFDWAVQEATAKKKRDFSTAEFRTYDEGLCVQCMHIGPYDTEPETLRQMDAFAAEQDMCRILRQALHHEIYLGDPRRTAQKNFKTVLRHPVTEKIKQGNPQKDVAFVCKMCYTNNICNTSMNGTGGEHHAA